MDEQQPPSQPKILIIRLSSIGDIVLTTPVVRAVNEQLPEAEVHFLVRKDYVPVVEYNPHIHKVHAYDPDNVDQTIEELRKENFSVVIDLHKTLRSRKVVRKLKVPSYTFNKHNFSKWICYRLKMNGMPETHIVERYFEAVRELNVHNDHKGLEFYIPEDQGFDEDDLPMMFEDGFVAVVLAAQHFTKRIPVSKVVEIGSILHKPIMLLGGKDVYEEGEQVVAQLGERATNGCGKYTLYQSAAILQHADCVITGDTGLMHISAALHKPTAAIFGSTIPEYGYYPYMPGERNLFRNFEVCPLRCRPCSKFGSSKCPRKHFKCMKNISATEVAGWVNRF
ncbi:MAG: glycosyltransferase family 9 protein [Bacteroidales bacterium]|nr:glycosyltransferase family 9 protein [Bacteroidales bacterium]